MKEVFGDAWILSAGKVLCITTNGCLKKSGECVMGRGIALEAARRFPNLPRAIGQLIQMHGNEVFLLGPWAIDKFHLQTQLVTFPVKHNWYEKADLPLIERSAKQLVQQADPAWTEIYLPRPGCGNGGLTWDQVKPILEPLFDDRFITVTR